MLDQDIVNTIASTIAVDSVCANCASCSSGESNSGAAIFGLRRHACAMTTVGVKFELRVNEKETRYKYRGLKGKQHVNSHFDLSCY